MNHIMVTGDKRDALLREQIFPRIASGNTILFLGAGASITDTKRFLSQELMALHRAREGFDLETDDIIDYVDTLSKNPRFERGRFDDQVAHYLLDLTPAAIHSTIARLPWREIITTNYDLLIERAHDQLHGRPDETHLLKVVRSREESNYRPAADEVVYVKLNGCVSDRSHYPLIFSSRDFEQAAPFYKIVLQSLENLSPNIQFLAVGYSFRDPFAQSLLKKFDRFNYRNRREMLLVDPGIQEARLPALAEEGIRVINSSSAEFFAAYEAWEDQSSESTLRRRRVAFTKHDSQRLRLSPRLAERLSEHIAQLGTGGARPVTPQNFYKGERPTFYVIEKGYDVVRSGLLSELASGVHAALQSRELILPIVALTGGYGMGKSTLGYRIVYELLHSDPSLLAFEVVDPFGLRSQDIRELLERSGAEHVLFLFDECEVDSSYKALVDLQADLSAFQVPGLHVAFIVPIRENILQKFKSRRSISSLTDFRADAALNRSEMTELLNRLQAAGLVKFADVAERDRKAIEAVEKYGGDPFVTLLTIVTDGQHDVTLRHAYQQLSFASRRAFLEPIPKPEILLS